MMYEFVCSHIPHVMQLLYVPDIKQSTSLEEIRDAFRPNQMECKAWLLEQLIDRDRNSKILVIGSWLGFTSYCLHKMGFSYIDEVDPDTRLARIAYRMNHDNQRFVHFTDDVNNGVLDSYDIVINTSCEHIENNAWFDRIRPGAWVALQSTNFVSADHVNTVSSLAEMKTKYPLVFDYTGEKQSSPVFTRFMVCGTKS